MTDSTELAQQLGAALGDSYVVERPLGQGGFAVVFLVKDLGLKRDLAVKVLSPDMITSKTVLERFRREAETVARLSHPNIVPLHFIGQKESWLPVRDVVRIMSEVASALAHAHKHGVVHRDIKPGNVLIDGDSGRSLVTDFGIARSGEANGLTATGMMIGTPAYLSPEQVTGEAMDHRVDIYALGVMAYEMLAGHVPFDGATPTAAMMKRLAGPPVSVATLRADVPADLADVITRCLAADQTERYDSAAEVIRALQGEMTTTGGRTTRTFTVEKTVPPVERKFSRNAIIATAALIVVVAAIALYVSRSLVRRDVVTAPSVVSPTPTVPGDANLVAIAQGDYIIGNDNGPDIVRPRHVEHVNAFRIERTEVTVDDYAKYVAAQRAPPPWVGAKPMGSLPVTRVPWGDAANYCVLKYPNNGRLPTEVEWEAAARGLSGREYPYGDTPDAANANTLSARRATIAPVASFPRGATPEGVQDMSGNVWEWTSSPMHAYAGAKPLPESMSQYRVIRGGAFDTKDDIATGWMRGYLKASAAPDELPNTGFRCVTSVAEAKDSRTK